MSYIVCLTRDRVRGSVLRRDIQRGGGSREVHRASTSTLSPLEGQHAVDEKRVERDGGAVLQSLSAEEGSQERMDAETEKKRTEESFTSAHWQKEGFSGTSEKQTSDPPYRREPGSSTAAAAALVVGLRNFGAAL